MKRTVGKVRLSEKVVRYSVKIEDDPSGPGVQARTRLLQLLVQLGQDPQLIACGFASPTKLAMKHDGEKWVIEGEAQVAE